MTDIKSRLNVKIFVAKLHAKRIKTNVKKNILKLQAVPRKAFASADFV